MDAIAAMMGCLISSRYVCRWHHLPFLLGGLVLKCL